MWICFQGLPAAGAGNRIYHTFRRILAVIFVVIGKRLNPPDLLVSQVTFVLLVGLNTGALVAGIGRFDVQDGCW